MKQKQHNRAFEIILITFIILTYIITFVCLLTKLPLFAFISYICQAVAVFLLFFVFHARPIPVEPEEESLSLLGEEQKQLADEQLLQIKELRDRTTEQQVTIEHLQRELQEAQASLSEKADAYTQLEEQLASIPQPDASVCYADFLPPAEDAEDTTIDILEIVKDTISELDASAHEANIRIQLASASSNLYVKAAPSRIRILFRNIIDNSIKYMQRTGILLITVSNIGSDIFVVLKDNGLGLDAAETDHIFELNFQGSNRISGNGLGLTQAKAIVDYYGGTIYAKSTPNQGMGIYIQLPTD